MPIQAAYKEMLESIVQLDTFVCTSANALISGVNPCPVI